MQRSNQFDHFSELGQREKSRRGICGIWSGVFTCDHFPKGGFAIAVRRVEVGFQTFAEI